MLMNNIPPEGPSFWVDRWNQIFLAEKRSIVYVSAQCEICYSPISSQIGALHPLNLACQFLLLLYCIKLELRLLLTIGCSCWIKSRDIGSQAIKLPICYPPLICGILLSPKPNLISTIEPKGPAPSLLSINPKLYQSSHVHDSTTQDSSSRTNGPS